MSRYAYGSVPPVERSLRRRFVILGAAAFAVVMLLLAGGLNLANRQLLRQQQLNMLEVIAANGGYYPDAAAVPGLLEDPEAAYRARYFSVYYREDQNTMLLRTRRVAAVDEREIIGYASAAIEDGAAEGQIGPYRYLHAAWTNGNVLVFLDTTRDTLAMRQMLEVSLLILLTALALVTLLLWFFSKRAVAPIVATLEKQKRFITDAGHELKTPLAVLSANIDVTELTGGETEWTRSSRKQINRLTERLDQLLRLARLDEQGTGSEPETIDLVRWSGELLDTFETRFKEKDIRTEVSSELRECIWTGQRETLEEISAILLDNAAHYTPQGGIFRLQLERTEGQTAALHYINTADVPDADLSHLFERFYRADHKNQRKEGGTGIGLSIAAVLAEQASWKLSVDKPAEDLIRFTLWLGNRRRDRRS